MDANSWVTCISFALICFHSRLNDPLFFRTLAGLLLHVFSCQISFKTSRPLQLLPTWNLSQLGPCLSVSSCWWPR